MVVRMRSTRSHTGNRRSHHALTAPNLAVCKNCGAYHRPHHMCLECGFYKGRIVVDMKAKKTARQERIQAKKAMMSAQAAQEAATTQEADEPNPSTGDTEEQKTDSGSK